MKTPTEQLIECEEGRAYLIREIKELHEAVEAAGLEYREDDGPRPYWRNNRALNAECDADKVERIADELADVVRMMHANDRVLRGEKNVTAWDGDFVSREREAALAAWIAYQNGFKHRGDGTSAVAELLESYESEVLERWHGTSGFNSRMAEADPVRLLLGLPAFQECGGWVIRNPPRRSTLTSAMPSIPTSAGRRHT